MRRIVLQADDNVAAADCFENTFGVKITTGEVFQGVRAGHKFQIGQKVVLFDMEQYPQFNGEVVTITSIRQDGLYGRAYYFETENEELFAQLNWAYEYRMRKVNVECILRRV